MQVILADSAYPTSAHIIPVYKEGGEATPLE